MIAFGLGHLIFVIVWLHIVWHEYCCLWSGLPRLCDCMAVRRVAPSVIVFGLDYPIFVIVCMHGVWHEYYCLWPGLPRLCDCMAARRMARV